MPLALASPAARHGLRAPRGLCAILVAAACMALTAVLTPPLTASPAEARAEDLGRALKRAAKDAAKAKKKDDDAPAPPRRSVIRFVTEAEYPPFNYYAEDGTLTGFNIDVARAICLEAEVSCDIQVRRWEDLIPALERGEADAIIASLAIRPSTLARVDFTDRYYFTPARFVARRDAPKLDITPVGLEGKRIGALRGTAHAAFLKVFFPDSIVILYDSPAAARRALIKRRIDLLFGDGITLSFWLNGTSSRGCCEFRGGPFAEPRYFGDGIGIAVRKGDTALRDMINTALARLRSPDRTKRTSTEGLQDLFLQYFPIKVY